MNKANIRVITENFRAIKNADLIINGITVVAGENGCGKSTLSNLLYYLYKTASNYDFLVIQELRFKLRNIERFLEIVVSDLYKISNERNTREEFKELHNLRLRFESLDESELDRWVSFVLKVQNNYYSQPTLFKDKSPVNPRLNNRLNFIVRDLLEMDETLNEKKIDELNPFQTVINLLKKLFYEALNKIKARPTSLFTEELKRLYSDGILPKKFEVYEFDDQIVSIDKLSLSIPYTIQNSIYIDTPMMVGVELSSNSHWDDLNDLLLKKGRFDQQASINSIISNEIISGDVVVDDTEFSSDNFSFKRKDGSVFRLLECATGIKSFAVLQLLLKNGSINDKTLLIIDEPESHLHPQWIIEYARIIVLLNKQVGTKFFISSHNPDMISAIRFISEKEGTLNQVSFYLAEKEPQDYTYEYKYLGNNIDPIFASFNIALDRINKYGV